ncbi:hypothetical protein Pmani_025200 [Petrolisthes manimaculis]|uniref:Uncharacterized protein n=1 Tax=Petrolisthes manimaculis TaxID=1843537 RepID=A0AAE1P8F3_9EUCA|nr:hypothetical protein Pmani_025200 [Petrolisthes manimaculis]
MKPSEGDETKPSSSSWEVFPQLASDTTTNKAPVGVNGSRSEDQNESPLVLTPALTSHSLYDSLGGLGWHWARGWHYAATPIEQREGRVVQPQVNLGSSYSNSYTCGGGRPGNCAEA